MMKEFGCNSVCLFEGIEIFLDVSFVLTHLYQLQIKGQSWSSISSKLPQPQFVLVVSDRIPLTAKELSLLM